jgi:hypothetical protein
MNLRDLQYLVERSPRRDLLPAVAALLRTLPPGGRAVDPNETWGTG